MSDKGDIGKKTIRITCWHNFKLYFIAYIRGPWPPPPLNPAHSPASLSLIARVFAVMSTRWRGAALTGPAASAARPATTRRRPARRTATTRWVTWKSTTRTTGTTWTNTSAECEERSSRDTAHCCERHGAESGTRRWPPSVLHARRSVSTLVPRRIADPTSRRRTK